MGSHANCQQEHISLARHRCQEDEAAGQPAQDEAGGTNCFKIPKTSSVLIALHIIP